MLEVQVECGVYASVSKAPVGKIRGELLSETRKGINRKALFAEEACSESFSCFIQTDERREKN